MKTPTKMTKAELLSLVKTVTAERDAAIRGVGQWKDYAAQTDAIAASRDAARDEADKLEARFGQLRLQHEGYEYERRRAGVRWEQYRDHIARLEESNRNLRGWLGALSLGVAVGTALNLLAQAGLLP